MKKRLNTRKEKGEGKRRSSRRRTKMEKYKKKKEK